jgi:FkbM family methyltransferase
VRLATERVCAVAETLGSRGNQVAAVCARYLLRIRERFFPRTQFATLPVIGRLIPLLLRNARSSVVENVHGHRMFVDANDSMGLSIDTAFEPLETQFCSQTVKPGQTVVDIGANIGYYTLLFAKAAGPSGRVFAFEPDPDNYRLLSANVTANGYANVTLVQAAVSNRAGDVILYRNDMNRMDHRTYDPGGTCERVVVPSLRLDEDLAAHGGRVDFVKMDIQGSEPAALGGMLRVLANNPAITLVTEFWPHGLTRAGHDPAGFLEQLAQLGFAMRRIDERRHEIVATSARELLGAYDPGDRWAATNIICTRE